MARGLGLAAAGGSLGGFEGIRQWMQDRQREKLVAQQLQSAQEQSARADQQLGLQERTFAEGQRRYDQGRSDELAAAQAEQDRQAAQLAQVEELAKTDPRFTGVAAWMRAGLKGSPPSELLRDPNAPEKQTPRPMQIRTKQGIQIVDANQAIGQTFEPEPDKPSGGGGGNPNRLDGNQAFSAIVRLGGQLQTNTKATREIMRQHQIMQQAWDGLQKGIGKGTAEQAIVSTFNKILDPNSVVREGEYDRTAQGQALLQRMEALGQRVSQGGQISPQVLADMVRLSQTYAAGADRFNKAETNRVMRLGQAFGLDTSLIATTPEDDAAAGAPPVAETPASPPQTPRRRRVFDPATKTFKDMP